MSKKHKNKPDSFFIPSQPGAPGQSSVDYRNVRMGMTSEGLQLVRYGSPVADARETHQAIERLIKWLTCEDQIKPTRP